MKSIVRPLLPVILLMTAWVAQAQQVNTLYFLENAPMRHLVNPAFQPVSNGYLNFTPFGYSAFWVGNNAFTLSDCVYRDPATGKIITPLHPDADRQAFLKVIPSLSLSNMDVTTDILGLGLRIKDNGYLHINILERMEGGLSTPRSMYDFVLGGGMSDLSGGVNTFDLSRLALTASLYTEIGVGYSHRINDQWTVGGKAKFLLGTLYAGMEIDPFRIDASTTEWALRGTGTLMVAAPLNWEALPKTLDRTAFEDFQFDNLINLDGGIASTLKTLLRPSGYGAAFDLGVTYKPIDQLQITASVTDLGFIYWNNARRYACTIDTIYTGVGDFNYNDYVVDGTFQTDSLMSAVTTNLTQLVEGIHATETGTTGFARMVSARLNVGVDANFWDNRVGVGVLSSTRLYNSRLYEEVTLGAAFRPVNWFNIALSYSLVNNGKYSNIGAGLSFMPYDGINMTLALDYCPTSYAYYRDEKAGDIPIAYKSKGMNVALGFSIVWGTNKKNKDSDYDGVFDKLDMCPNTPTNVRVDDLGCPLDSDGDGVPDYLDQCPNTPSAAYGMIDSVGCPLDTDGDSVPDYLDKCPDTPEAAYGLVDDFGCPLDSDGDGVPDYLDLCPNTPEAAYGFIDEFGCPLDTDGDGVPDYLDKCPNTPEAAYLFIDTCGCPLDSDGDGVPDYLDQCPGTPEAAYNFIDTCGCPLDTDGDGVPDYLDECPTVPGSKDNKGCPEVKREVRNLLKKAMQGIQFDNGKATIKKSSNKLLDQIAQTFIDNPTFKVEVQGHTDNTGNYAFNVDLSERRAQTVRNYLIKKGVPATSLTAHGYGPDRPIADNKTKKGRGLNRRVEFDITFEEVSYIMVNDRVQPHDSVAAPAETPVIPQPAPTPSN